MLGKLFRHEFKNTAKVILIVYGVFIAITALGMFFFSRANIVESENSISTLLLAAYLLLYILAGLTVLIITTIYLIVYFYKTMYGAQGYLTHTLPVKSLTIFHVKLLVAAFWTFSSILLFILAFLGLFWAFASANFSSNYIAYEFNEAKAVYLSSLGMRTPEFIVYIISSLILSGFVTPIRFFTSCSIGQLFHTNKIAASAVSGIIIYFTHSLWNSIITDLVDSYRDSSALLFGDTVWLLYLSDFIVLGILYLISNFIIRKRINLE